MCFRESLLCCVLPIHQRGCHVRDRSQKTRRPPSRNSVFYAHVIYCCILPYLHLCLDGLHLSSICQAIFWNSAWWFELTIPDGNEWTLDLTLSDKWMGDMWICPLWSRQGNSCLFDYTIHILLPCVTAPITKLSWCLWKLNRKSWISLSTTQASQQPITGVQT